MVRGSWRRVQPMKQIFRQMAACGLRGVAVRPATIDLCPPLPGAYALVIVLARGVVAPSGRDQGRGRSVAIDPGTYIYAGSAYGSGGLRARIARHMRPDKICHWHVDHLTAKTSAIAALAIVGGAECAIVAALQTDKHFVCIAPGFGSSDCRTCESHLLEQIRSTPAHIRKP